MELLEVRNLVDKVGAILALYSFQQPVWGVADIARELAMPKSSVSELLASLASQGLVERVARGRYRLGWRLFTLNQVLLESTPLVRESRAVMHEIVERHGETSHLMVLERDRTVVVEKVQATLATQILMSRIGIRQPAHCSASGKILLAQLPEAELDALFGQAELERFTPNTITRFEQLRSELGRARLEGIAFDREEIVPGLRCVAAPIRDASGAAIAAISVSTPTYRFIAADAVAVVRRAAERISQRLGHKPPAAAARRPRPAAGNDAGARAAARA